LLIGILGLLTALVTNLDKIQELVDSFRSPTEPVISGEWTGVFKEYWPETPDSLHGATETITFTCDKHNKVAAKIGTPVGEKRHWKAVGEIVGSQNNRMFVMYYVSTDPERPMSNGAYVLNYDVTKNSYFGYRMGYDKDLKKIVAFPYILTLENSATAQESYKDYLNKPALY